MCRVHFVLIWAFLACQRSNNPEHMYFNACAILHLPELYNWMRQWPLQRWRHCTTRHATTNPHIVDNAPRNQLGQSSDEWVNPTPPSHLAPSHKLPRHISPPGPTSTHKSTSDKQASWQTPTQAENPIYFLGRRCHKWYSLTCSWHTQSQRIKHRKLMPKSRIPGFTKQILAAALACVNSTGK